VINWAILPRKASGLVKLFPFNFKIEAYGRGAYPFELFRDFSGYLTISI